MGSVEWDIDRARPSSLNAGRPASVLLRATLGGADTSLVMPKLWKSNPLRSPAGDPGSEAMTCAGEGMLTVPRPPGSFFFPPVQKLKPPLLSAPVAVAGPLTAGSIGGSCKLIGRGFCSPVLRGGTDAAAAIRRDSSKLRRVTSGEALTVFVLDAPLTGKLVLALATATRGAVGLTAGFGVTGVVADGTCGVARVRFSCCSSMSELACAMARLDLEIFNNVRREA